MAIFHLGMQSTPKTILPVAATIPTGTTPIYVTGAGFTSINKTYTWASGTGDWRYLTSYKIYRSGDTWKIGNISLAVDYYENTGGDAGSLPKTGWAPVGATTAPAPTISETAP